MYKLFRNVLQECTDFSSLYCMRIFGLYLLMLYLEFSVATLYSLFSGQMSILTMLIQNFIYSFPPLLMLHIKCIWAPLIFSFLHIRIILKRCVEIGSTFIHFVTRWRFEAKLLLENLLLFSFYTPCLLFTIVLDNKFVLWTLLL